MPSLRTRTRCSVRAIVAGVLISGAPLYVLAVLSGFPS